MKTQKKLTKINRELQGGIAKFLIFSSGNNPFSIFHNTICFSQILHKLMFYFKSSWEERLFPRAFRNNSLCEIWRVNKVYNGGTFGKIINYGQLFSITSSLKAKYLKDFPNRYQNQLMVIFLKAHRGFQWEESAQLVSAGTENGESNGRSLPQIPHPKMRQINKKNRLLLLRTQLCQFQYLL